MSNELDRCRVCLGNSNDYTKCLSLFESYEESTVCAHIWCLARVQIREGDGLPDRICPECLLQLGAALAFRRKCEASDKLLHNDIKYSPAVIEDTEISVKKENSIDFYVESHGTPDNILNTVQKVSKLNRKSTNSEPKSYKLRQVSVKHKKFGILYCDDCGDSFKTKCKLRVHWKNIHLPNKLVCPNCKRTFKTFKALNTHIKLKLRSCMAAGDIHIDGQGKSRTFHCKYCTFEGKTLTIMVAHLVVHTGEKRYQCKDCPKSYSQPASLQSHREFRHKHYRIETTCHICGKLLRGREAAYKHIRTHTPKMVQCKICNKEFKNRSILITHMKRHSGIKSCACEACGATFYTIGELDIHTRRVHLKSQAYKCDMCAYSTFNEYYLNKHKSKHNGSNIPCLVCGTFLDDVGKFALHQKKHLEKNYRCSYCEKMYSTKHSLAKHVRFKHKNKPVSRKGTE